MAKAKLRVIDQGTRYDILGQLRLLERRIQRGELGRVSHIAVGIKHYDDAESGDIRPMFTTLSFGAPTMADLAYTADMMKKRMTGLN